MTDETQSHCGVRIDDRGWGRYVDIPSRVQETGSGTIDPYNDFISEGGKLWDRIKGVAEANDCVRHMLQVLTAAR
jgi:ureidoacrylate peracid hydrolase